MTHQWAPPELVRHAEPITDYGRYHGSNGSYLGCSPRDLGEVQAAVALANRRRLPVRVRGAGHSMNGSAVPCGDEMVLSSSGLCHFRFDGAGTVSVGAGAAVWDVDQMLRNRGFQLLLRNDGGAAAATVGGFVSAGGIGADTWRHGGFWETVEAVLFVAGSGAVIRCTRHDPLFPWLFGSMGQLGVVVEVTLRIGQAEDHPLGAYPMGEEGLVRRSATSWEHNLWLTLFVPEEELAERAAAQLEEASRRYRDVWEPRGGYAYFVRFHSFNPPLVYPAQQSFVAVGTWGMLPSGVDEIEFGRLRALDADVTALLRTQARYRRYVQSEVTFEDFDFVGYFGDHVFNGFRERKRTCDPHSLLGRGSVFR